MPYKPGQSGNPVGRKPGVPNHLTRTVKAAFEDAFSELQKDPTAKHALVPWAMRNPDKFYILAMKLIPAQVAATVDDAGANLDPTQRAARLAAVVAAIEARKDGEDLA